MNISTKKIVQSVFKTLTILFVCVLFLFVSCASGIPADAKEAFAQLEATEASSVEGADIIFYADNLLKNHIGISELVSVSDFCNEAVMASERLDEAALVKTDAERRTMLYFELIRLAAMLHDGHTGIGLTEEIYGDFEFYPFDVDPVSGGLVLTALSSEYAEYVGMEIAEINGNSSDKVISALKTIVSYDTEAYAMANVAGQLNNRQALEFTGLGSDDGILRMKLADGSEIDFEPLHVTELASFQFNTLVTTAERTLCANSYYECYDLSDDVLFVQYNTCTNAEGYSVADFTDDVIGFIDNNGFSRVIVDLRFNGGGNSMLFDSFINKLGKRISSGKCKGFVLIGTNTFSSAVLNAWDLKNAGCTLVGTPTGGAVNHYGEVKVFSLPNSGIMASYSSKLFIQDKNAGSGSILPDVLVEFSVDDFRSGRDVQVAACLDM